MKKNIIYVLILSLVIILATSACGTNSANQSDNSVSSSTESSKDIVIAGIYKAGDQVWFIEEGKYSEQMVKSLGASKFLFLDAKMNPDTYLQQIDNVIAQKVSGVLTCPPDQKLSKVVVEKLKTANIPVIAVDDALEDENHNKLAPWVGIDAYNIGKAAGEWVANYAKQNALDKDSESGLLILTMDTVSSCVPRAEGELDAFKNILPDYPNSQIFKADTDGTTDEGFNAASAIFTAHPEVKKWMVVGANEESVVGATRALEQIGLDEQSVTVGLGGYLAKDEFKKPYSAMKAAAYFSAKDVGETAAKLLMDHILNGEEIPMETAVPAVIITKDNYMEIMGESAN